MLYNSYFLALRARKITHRNSVRDLEEKYLSTSYPNKTRSYTQIITPHFKVTYAVFASDLNYLI
jgi:hypothetical protein